MSPKDTPEQMAAMNAWLDDVCRELGVDRAAVAEVTPTLLRLIGKVAHGPSRPAAPITAFALGLAAAQATDVPARVARDADRLAALIDGQDGR